MKIKILSILALLLTMTQGAWADDKADYGVLNGEFSVSAGKKVHFSQGNLRAFYNSSESWEWYFSTNQWDYVGYADGNKLIIDDGILSSDSHSVDLFCWSTNVTYYGIHNSKDDGTYNGSFKDWGTNAIINGGSKANIWYTPSQDEWTYLLNTRSGSTIGATANARYTYATINTDGTSENGMILFPDGVTFEASEATTWGTINNNSNWSTKCTTDQWAALEAKGCVFLPTAGWRSGTNEGGGAEDRGRYWLATSIDNNSAYSIFFGTASGTAANDYYRRFGRSVRLVIESHTITYNANGGTGSVDAQPKYTGLDRTLSDGTGLTRSGYILDGWATTADGAKVYDLGATYTADADVTLYAHWTPVNDVTWDATDEEKSNWSISPVNPVTVGAAVTATYSGSRHVKSVTYRPAGTIGGQFTVNASGDKVYFSKGNLQYIGSAATPYWKFADNQWDYLGTSSGQNSSATNVDRDLFGWGTKTDPYKTSDQSNSYSWNEWGENAITNGGNRINSGWRTLESTEWAYLWNSRDNAANLLTLATVNNVTGLILMPDGWTASGVALTVTTANYTTNNINSTDWNTLEQQGCVFLPAGGYRHGTEIIYAGSYGAYWSSTSTSSDKATKATSMDFSSSKVEAYNTNRSTGCSVRLVRPVVELSPNAEKTVWTLASMPAYDIELSAEYYDEVTLTDGEAITALNTYTGQEIWVNYTRSFTADKASTVCLPFAYTKKTGDGSFYAFSGIEKVGSEYIATMTEPGTSTLTANTPYLYKAETTGVTDFSGTYAIPASIEAGTTTSGDWKFVGTYTTQTWDVAPTGIYGFSAKDANDGITQGEFVKVGAYVRVKPMRCYLKYKDGTEDYSAARSFSDVPNTLSEPLPEKIKVRFVDANGEVTGIGTLDTQTGEVNFDSKAWYTLDGVRLNAQPTQKGIYVNNGKKVVIK